MSKVRVEYRVVKARNHRYTMHKQPEIRLPASPMGNASPTRRTAVRSDEASAKFRYSAGGKSEDERLTKERSFCAGGRATGGNSFGADLDAERKPQHADRHLASSNLSIF